MVLVPTRLRKLCNSGIETWSGKPLPTVLQLAAGLGPEWGQRFASSGA